MRHGVMSTDSRVDMRHDLQYYYDCTILVKMDFKTLESSADQV